MSNPAKSGKKLPYPNTLRSKKEKVRIIRSVGFGAITITAPNGRSSRISANTRHPIPIQ